MRLTYRGISYKSNSPAVDFTDGEIGYKYRGENSQHPYVRHIPVPQPVAELKYRGVQYCKGDSLDVEFMQVRKQYASAENITEDNTCNAIVPTVCTPLFHDISHIHSANLRKNLERRLEVAKANGDENLVRLLEMEAKQLV